MRKTRENIESRDGHNYDNYSQSSIKNMFRKNLSPSIRVVILMMLVTGITYPLVLTGIGQVIFPFQSNNSVVTMNGKNPVGSMLIGQEFTSPKFLHIRPATLTASGVDPHITPEDAFEQAANVSKATGIPINTILTLIELNIERNKVDNLIVFAPHYVNVLEVNMELVRQYPEVYPGYRVDTMNKQGDST